MDKYLTYHIYVTQCFIQKYIIFLHHKWKPLAKFSRQFLQVLPSVSVTVVFKTAYFFFFCSIALLRNIFFQLKGCFHQAPFTGQKRKHGEAGINVSQMEVNKNTGRRVSHGATDNYSSIKRCYAKTSGKVTYLSANIYRSKKHNILEDLSLPRKP